jgi:hypothetical protein
MSKDVRDAMRTASLIEGSLPKVVFVYGEPDRILGSANGSYGLRIASMMGLQNLLNATGMRGLWH